jgi:hypothetical protein
MTPNELFPMIEVATHFVDYPRDIFKLYQIYQKDYLNKIKSTMKIKDDLKF